MGRPQSAKEFYESLFDGQEYYIVMMNRDNYWHETSDHFKEQSTLSIKQHNKAFKNDPVHLELSKDVSKARKVLRNYEFDINTNKK